jgi:UDP:flavonoid glycosyltransferase YjiC (YdhE family)
MDPAQFQPLPANVRLERYIPQTLIFPYCDAVIFHGGYNSLHSALWHGLPMVLMPMGAGDQYPTAQRCAEIEAGVLVEGNPPQAVAILAAAKAVLGQSTYREHARQLQQEIRALPDLSEAVHRLEKLGREREPQLQEKGAIGG